MSIASASSSPPSRRARSTPQLRWLERSTIDRGPPQLASGEAGRAMETCRVGVGIDGCGSVAGKVGGDHEHWDG